MNLLWQDKSDLLDHYTPLSNEQIDNNYGMKGFGGACPPSGDGIHYYYLQYIHSQ